MLDLKRCCAARDRRSDSNLHFCRCGTVLNYATAIASAKKTKRLQFSRTLCGRSRDGAFWHGDICDQFAPLDRAKKSERDDRRDHGVATTDGVSLRACSFTQIATKDYLETNIFNAPTGSEGPLGSLSEQVAVGVYGNTSVAPIILLRNSQNPTTPQELSTDDNLINYNLIEVDLLLQWVSANGRTRTRQLSAVFGKGNIGP